MAEGKSDEPSEQPRTAKNMRSHALTAAMLGGAAAATAGAVWGARALARRNSADGKPINSVLETACTASELRQCAEDEEEPAAEPKPKSRIEPREA